MTQIRQIKAFAGPDGSLHIDGGGGCYTPRYINTDVNSDKGDYELYVSGDLGGGIGIEFDNGLVLMVGTEPGGPDEPVRVWFERDGERVKPDSDFLSHEVINPSAM